MRLLLVPLAMLLLVAMAPTTGAHREDCAPDALCHLTLNVQDLAPGAEQTYALHSERVTGDFPAGWIVTTFAGIQGEGRVEANLTLANETRHQWSWTGNQYSSNSTRIHERGHYVLTLHNPGAATVRYAFYFDQSCNCASKFIPLNGGFVLFNYDLPAERDVRLGFPTIDGWHLKGQLARLANESGAWPQDFRTHQTQEQKNKGWLQFDFRTEEAGTYYVFIQAVEGVTQGPDGRPMPVELTPLLEVEDAKAPFPGPLLALAGLVCVALVLRRR